jgi:hypothetical protein
VGLTEFGKQVMKGQSGLDRPLPITPLLGLRIQSLRLPRPIAAAAGPATATPASGEAEGVTRPTDSPGEPNGATERADNERAASESDQARSESAPAPSNGEYVSAPATQPDWYWTWKVLQAGCSVAECEQIRQLEPTVIYDHLLAATEAGHLVEFDWIMTPEQQRRLQQNLAAGANSEEAPEIAHLDPRQIQLWHRLQERMP